MTLRNFLHFHTLKLSLLLFVKDLKFLSDDLEGRSPNPVSLLFDTLSNPDADLGMESPSLLQWKHHADREISHVVLGKKEEGGIWQVSFCPERFRTKWPCQPHNVSFDTEKKCHTVDAVVP